MRYYVFAKWKVVIAIILTVSLFLVPSVSAYAAVQVMKNKSSLDYVEIIGEELNNLVKIALVDDDVQTIVKELIDSEYKVVQARGSEFTISGKRGHFLNIVLQGSETIQLFFSKFDGNTKVGAGVIHRNGSIEVYDVYKGKVYNTSLIEIVNGKQNITWKEGFLVENATNSINTESIVPMFEWDSCSICTSVCGTIYSLGCTVTGYFACVAACAPIGTATCPLICGVVFAAICGGAGTFITCPILCTDLGFCD